MFKFINDFRGLPKEIYILFTANVINRFGDFVSPFLTLYLTSKLNMTPQVASMIVTITVLSRMPGSILGGKLADHHGRRKVYLILQSIAALSLIPCAYIESPKLVILLLITATFFNGAVRPALDALATDLIPDDKRKIGFSLMYLGINLGVAIGPTLAGLLFRVNLPLFFLIDAATSLIAVSLVYFLISNEAINTIHQTKGTDNSLKESTIDILKSNFHLTSFIFLASGFSLVYAQTKFSLPLLFSQVFAENSSALLGTVFSANAIAVLVLTAWVTSKTKHNHSVMNIILAGGFYALGFGAYGLITSYPLFIIATIIWTTGEILHATNNKVYIAEQTPANYRGRVIGVSLVLKSFMNAMGILIGGWLIPLIGPHAIWYLISVLALTFSGLLYISNKDLLKKHKKVLSR